MCSHQTSRTSQISHYRIKYEVCISFKKNNLRKARQKNRSSRPEVLCNTCARVSFLIKLQAKACNFIKKVILTQVFSCEFSGISKNTFFYRTIPVAASEKRQMQKTRYQRNINNEILMRKRRNHQHQKQWSEKYCITLCHSLSLVVIRCLFVVPLVVTRCTTRLPFSTVLSSSKFTKFCFFHFFSL